MIDNSVPQPPFSKSKTTLCYLLQDNEILLAMKKRGFGTGKWNGVGGKVEKNESVLYAAKREAREEIGVEIQDLKKAATLHFYFSEEVEKLGKAEETSIYLCRDWKGEIRETDEMKPRWFKISDIPYDGMWTDDIYWMPQVLDGKFVEGEFWFDKKFQLVNHKVKITPLM